MPGALNTQTDRTVRYEQRCLKKRCDDQKKQRAERALKRDEFKDEISKEVSSHIRSECDKKKRMSSRMKTTTSFVDFF
jgi:hypothetical protein